MTQEEIRIIDELLRQSTVIVGGKRMVKAAAKLHSTLSSVELVKSESGLCYSLRPQRAFGLSGEYHEDQYDLRQEMLEYWGITQ